MDTSVNGAKPEKMKAVCAMAITRQQIIKRLRNEISHGHIILGAGAGTGITAKFAEAGGVDLIVIYNSGKFRMAGRGSLAGLMPYGDANKIVLEMGSEILPVVKNTPVVAGLCGTDPFRLMEVFLRKIKESGFSGVQNFPTVGLIDGTFRMNLEETGMGYALEVDMIRKASEMDLFSCPYVFTPQNATAMAKAGADMLVAHMGLTTNGAIGARTALSLEDCVKRVQAIADAGRAVNPDILVICHGGPIALRADVEYVLSRTTNVHGFFGASSIERFAAEESMQANARSFKSIETKRRNGEGKSV